MNILRRITLYWKWSWPSRNQEEKKKIIQKISLFYAEEKF